MLSRLPRKLAAFSLLCASAVPLSAAAQTIAYGNVGDGGDEPQAGSQGDFGGKGRSTRGNGGGRVKYTDVSPYIEAKQIVTAELSPGDDVVTYSVIAAGVDAEIQGLRNAASVSLRYERRFGWGNAQDTDLISGVARGYTTVMPGVQIDRAKVDFAHAAALATEFQMVLGLQTMQTATGAHGDFEAALSALCAAGLLDEEDRRRAADRLEPLAHSPSVVAHNDFTPWNVLLDGEHLGVIDWGEAQEHGYVGVDLACMLCHLAFAKEGAQDRDAIVDLYEAIVVRKGTYGAMIDRLLRRYLAALGLDATLVAALRLMTWVYRADCELQLTKAEAGASALETLSERSIILGLLRAELALDHAEVSATSENAE